MNLPERLSDRALVAQQRGDHGTARLMFEAANRLTAVADQLRSVRGAVRRRGQDAEAPARLDEQMLNRLHRVIHRPRSLQP